MYNAHLHVLHVAKEMLSPSLDPNNEVGIGEGGLKGGILDGRLEKFVARWLPQHAKLICKVRFGQPCKEIIEYTNQEEINLIVMATHGRTGLNHLMMGSVAEKVMRLSPVPVLSVKPQRPSAIMNAEYQEESVISEMRTHELHH
jgi:nucleotide-binding universal stress UspA family protein